MVGGALAGLQDHVKLAREYAVEGLYDTSVIFFDGAIAQINKYSLRSLLLLCLYLSTYLWSYVPNCEMRVPIYGAFGMTIKCLPQ